MERDDAIDAAAHAIQCIRDVRAAEYKWKSDPNNTSGFIAQEIGMATSNLVFSTIGIGTASSSVSPLKVHGRPLEIKPFEVYLDMEMLNDKSSAYNVDPETLANLWVVRFGKDWVDAENIGAEDKEDIWWRHAANRLRELGYLEMHTLASSYRVVLRIVE